MGSIFRPRGIAERLKDVIRHRTAVIQRGNGHDTESQEDRRNDFVRKDGNGAHLFTFFSNISCFLKKKNSRQPFLLENIKPAFAGEPKQHGGHKNGHDAQNDKIAVFPMKLRHVIEIHAVNPRDERQRDKNGRDDS